MKWIIFLVINFAALGIGSLLIGNPSTNVWYQQLNKAPWTPPGWVFGFAWTTIMFCFTIFLWKASSTYTFQQLQVLYIMYAIQFVLNVMWNPIFFRWHMMGAGLIVIILLTVVVAWFLYWGYKHIGMWSFFILPYFLWLLVATSLNAYALLKN